MRNLRSGLSKPPETQKLAQLQSAPMDGVEKGLIFQLRGNLSPTQIQQLSPAALAYVGDAVYELFVRTYYLLPPRKPRLYHGQVVAQVRAESQAQQLRSLEPHLTPAERNLLKRGRNAAGTCPRRLNPEIYQQATSLETLVGYLYLSDPARLTYLLAQLNFDTAADPLTAPLPECTSSEI